MRRDFYEFAEFVAYVLHSNALGAVNSNICVTFVFIKKKEFFSTADWRTRIKLIFVMGLNRISFLPSPPAEPGLTKCLSMYLSSC